MLISRAPEVDGLVGAADAEEVRDDHAAEYQTANELFELMSRNHSFEPTETESLTAQDLVLLYKNLDIGTRLMSGASETKVKKPNQFVETIVYNDESDGSDECEVFSNNEMRDVIYVNRERIDLINSQPSFNNKLCHKFGNFQFGMDHSEYDKYFFLNDPFITEQIKSLNQSSNILQNSSLLDYVCCRRLADNNNLYMDNIITYVKRTIDQLKRISNGDYLTDRAKEKWRESYYECRNNKNDSLVLATSTSIPLRIEQQITCHTTWEDIVHSEVDLRSLTKILERKIILDIPRDIAGTYLFSKKGSDSLVISCKEDPVSSKGKEVREENEPRLDVVVQLNCSESRHMISNISSIKVLQVKPAITTIPGTEPLALQGNDDSSAIEETSCAVTETLALPCNDESCTKEEAEKVVEIKEALPCYDNSCTKEEAEIVKYIKEALPCTNQTCTKQEPEKALVFKEEESAPIHCEDVQVQSCNEESIQGNEEDTLIGYLFDEDIELVESECESQSSSLNEALQNFKSKPNMLTTTEQSQNLADIPITVNVNEHNDCNQFDLMSADKLQITMQRLNVRTPLPEESGDDVTQKPSKVSKKSPTRYRIKSPYENKSHALEENKRKKLLEIRERREKRKIALSEKCKAFRGKYGKYSMVPQPSGSVTNLSITNKAFYNSIYGLKHETKKSHSTKPPTSKKETLPIVVPNILKDDEADNESLDHVNNKYVNRSFYLDNLDTEVMHTDIKDTSISDSTLSHDLSAKLNIFAQLTCQTSNDLDPEINQSVRLEGTGEPGLNNLDSKKKPQIKTNLLAGTPRNKVTDNGKDVKRRVSFECRKSIGKIYDLLESNRVENESVPDKNETNSAGFEMIHPSESGSSLKHKNLTSFTSCSSFSRPSELPEQTAVPALEPKVIISNKLQAQSKTEIDKFRKSRNSREFPSNPPIKDIQENPLKAISQLLHEFDTVQKTKRLAKETKLKKKPDIPRHSMSDGKTSTGPAKVRSRLVQNQRDNELRVKQAPQSRRVREALTTGMGSRQNSPTKKDVINQQKMSDILDEVKEARGEAVRGPLKPFSRLNSLAQPRKTYVQAHSEEYQNRYGRNLMSDRLQRMAQLKSERPPNYKLKRTTQEKLLPSSLPPPERAPRVKQSSSINPELNHKFVPHKIDEVTSENMNNKMVAVASYVNYHYGRGGRPNTKKILRQPTIPRIPYFPNDLEFGTANSLNAEDSISSCSKLHLLIDSMFPSHKTSLNAVKECTESTSTNKDMIYNEAVVNVSVESIEAYSNGLNNVQYDNCIVEEVANNSAETVNHNNKDGIDESMASRNELQKLENALSRLSFDTPQNRLRLKSLTVTPKQSLQQIFLLQSGDASSLFVKPSRSNVKCCKSQTNTSSKISTRLPDLYFDLNFNNIPMQIATIGYAFPEYGTKVQTCISMQNINRFNRIDTVPSEHPEVHLNTSEKKVCYNLNEAYPKIKATPSFANNDEHEVAVEFVDQIAENLIKDCFLTSGCCSTTTLDVEKPVTKTDSPALKTSKDTEILHKIEYRSSLDMLVGILNEIKSISTCQTKLSHVENCKHDNVKNKDLQTLLNSMVPVDEPSNIECACNSIMLSDDQNDRICKNSVQTLVDKEVGTELPLVMTVNKVIETQSQFFPIAVNHSTHITNSIIDISDSCHSSLSFGDITADHFISSLSPKSKIIEQLSHDNFEKNKTDYVVRRTKPDRNENVDDPKHILNNSEILKTGNTDTVKMKRDILVTVYSILVLTVFAALSLPDVF